MANPNRDIKPPRFRYFYINGVLYKTRRVEKRNNMLYAWDCRTHKLTGFLYSDVRALGQTAYRIGDVARLLGCSPVIIRRYEREGRWTKPMRWKPELDGNKSTRYYSQDMIREMREAMSEIHRGRPRPDGMIVPRITLPSADELEAKFRNDEVFYVKEGDEFIPVWKAKF